MLRWPAGILQNMHMDQDPEQLKALLHELGGRLADAGIDSDAYVFGEHVVVLDTDMRCDVSDHVGVYHPEVTAETIAAGLGRERGLPPDWFPGRLAWLDHDALPFESGRLLVAPGNPSIVLALLLASPYPARHAAQVRTVLAHAGVDGPEAAASLALETYDSHGIGIDADDLLPDLREILS